MNLAKLNKPLLWISFSLYILLLLFIVTLKCADFDMIIGSAAYLLKYELSDRFVYGFIEITNINIYKDIATYLNILILVPMGLYLPLLFKKYRFIRDLLISEGFILLVEILQLFSGLGTFSIIDIFANTLGFIIGSLILYFSKLLNHHFLVNIINIIIIILATPVLCFAIARVIINIDYYKDFPWFRIYKLGPSLDYMDFPLPY